MAVFAVAESVPHWNFYAITKGKKYPVITEDGPEFMIKDDKGHLIFCLWEGCGFLEGGDWARIEEPDLP